MTEINKRAWKCAALIAAALLLAWSVGYITSGIVHDIAVKQSLRGNL